MTGKYAAGTEVTVDRSREEIRRTLQRFGATATAFFERHEGDVEIAAIAFEYEGLRVQMAMHIPGPANALYRYKSDGTRMPAAQIQQAHAKEQRRRWRSLALGIKAKLALIEDGLVSFEEEWLAHIALPGGATVGERVIPDLHVVAHTGELPALVPGRPAITARVIELPERTGAR